MHKKRPVAKCFATGPVSLNLPNHVTLQKASVYTSRPEGGGLGRSPKTEGAIGRKAHLTAGDGASLRLSYFLPRFHEAARKIGVGYRQPPASTNPSANRNCTARRLPQSPAVTAPSRRELRRAAAVNAHDSFLLLDPSLTRPPGCPRCQFRSVADAGRHCPDPPGVVTAAKN